MLKVLVISSDSQIIEAAKAYAKLYDGQIVWWGGDWSLGAGEALVVFAHGEMARIEQISLGNSELRPAYIGDDARARNPRDAGDDSDDEERKDDHIKPPDHVTAADLRAELLKHRVTLESKIRIQACESADVNSNLSDQAELEDATGTVHLPDSFAGELGSELGQSLGGELHVKGRAGQPNLDHSVPFGPDSPIWRERTYHPPDEEDNFVDDEEKFKDPNFRQELPRQSLSVPFRDDGPSSVESSGYEQDNESSEPESGPDSHDASDSEEPGVEAGMPEEK